MNNLPRKLTTVAVGSAGMLTVLKFEVSLLSYFVVIGILIVCLANMILQWETDNFNNQNGDIDGKVQRKVSEILHPKTP